MKKTGEAGAALPRICAKTQKSIWAKAPQRTHPHPKLINSRREGPAKACLIPTGPVGGLRFLAVPTVGSLGCVERR
jgi:hypothetical protein